MTERIYETDAYCREFSATVLSCDAVESGFAVVCDRTAFFPEGGGQAADEGTLGGAKVLDVQRRGEDVIHTVETPLAVGDTVQGVLDWELRYRRMQSHTGEHILSGVIFKLFGYSNVGFHMSEKLMTVDVSGTLTAEDVERIEYEANMAVYQNAEIIVTYPSAEELSALPYRSKIDLQEDTRIVTIGEVDCCACCAPHLHRSGEVGLIKVVDFAPYKKGTRIDMLAGFNAFLDYAALNAANKRLMSVLSAPRHGVEDAAREQSEALGALHHELQELKKRLALHELQKQPIGDAVFSVAAGLSYDELRHCSNVFAEEGASACFLFSACEDGLLYVVSSQVRDVRPVAAMLNSTFSGRGGGKPNYAQGKIAPCEESALKTALESAWKAE